MPKAPSSNNHNNYAPSHGPNLNVLKRNQVGRHFQFQNSTRINSRSSFGDGLLGLPSVSKTKTGNNYIHRSMLNGTSPLSSLSTLVLNVNRLAMLRDHAQPAFDLTSMPSPILPPGPFIHQNPTARLTKFILQALELPTGADGPRTKYEKLENRIAELEALLQKKNTYSDSNVLMSPQNGSPASSHHDSGFGSESDSRSSGSTPALVHAPLSMPSMDVTWTHWPVDLPGPDLLRHLVEAFFTFNPHASQLFHAPTFMTSLNLPSNHPKFPAVPVLHAICAIASSYTTAVTSPPPADFEKIATDEMFTARYRIEENRPDSFSEQQATLAKEAIQRMEVLGLELVQVLQSSIILSWYYCSHARGAELFLNCAHSMRLCVPLGLNVCPPFHTISKTIRPASVLKPAKNVIEDEMRRNVFWLAYAVERQHGCSNGWALSLDDSDISQLLPVQSDQFETGKLVPPSERQWAHSNDLLTVHPENQTDGMILYIKASILLSKVKTFNLRFRAKHFSGDGEDSLSYGTFCPDEPVDPRNSMTFIDLDGTVTSFMTTFPSHLRSPVDKNKVNCTLFAAMVMSQVAMINLHEPHADIRSRGCISALKMLTASRAIIDLVCSAWGTAFDLSLLEGFVSYCFFAGGRVVARFLQAAIEEDAGDLIKTFQHELGVLRSAIDQMSSRHRIAAYLIRMLDGIAEERWSNSQLSVGFLGPFGTYTHQSGVYCEKTTITDALVSLDSLDYVVVPRENSTFGSVTETFDGLRYLKEGFIQGEVVMRIEHCLVVKKGAKLSDIDCVLSHEQNCGQALGQCQKFISTHLTSATTSKTTSTAAAADAVSKSEGLNIAAICSKICVTMFENLEILEEGIQDEDSCP
ncbi:Prephenate dehydratase-domain-containing protein [Rhodocollybia butyracea]|uniref:Prephenate dehydratase-domain-containing protein n=1 Tax=Rhodocollybia butyracea TaxID=206335 RepID=A0A9P5PSD6_9AGAR|nr:Prephenate dehydratase-domain-containing protein [Rhodocollybia butyracea]